MVIDFFEANSLKCMYVGMYEKLPTQKRNEQTGTEKNHSKIWEKSRNPQYGRRDMRRDDAPAIAADAHVWQPRLLADVVLRALHFEQQSALAHVRNLFLTHSTNMLAT